MALPHRWLTLGLLVALVAPGGASSGDETCQSPYLPKITGQEDFVYVASATGPTRS
jgi:hypothetical protein